MRDQCIKSVEAALGRPLRAGEAAEIEQRIVEAKKQLAIKDRKAYMQMPENERLVEAGKLVSESLQSEFAKKQQRLALDMLAAQRAKADIEANTQLSPLNTINRMLAVFNDGKSQVQSVDSQAQATSAIAKSMMLDVIDATKGKWLGLANDVEMNRDIVRELHGTDTGNAVAAKAAKQFQEVAEILRERFNRAGGMVGKLEDWAMPHVHSAFKVAKAGRDAWVNDILPMISRERYVNEDGSLMSDAQLREFLNESYVSIATDGANKMEAGRYSGAGGKRSNRGSESRVLHFKGGDEWLAYQAKYGEGDLLQIMTQHIDGIARDIALVERFGSNPNHMLKMLLDEAEKSEKLSGGDLDKINKMRRRTERLYDEVARNNVAVSTTLAEAFAAYRSINVASRLGGATLSSFTDAASIARTAWMHGLAYHRIFGQGLKNLNPLDASDRELARSIGLGIEEMLASMNRYNDDGLTTTATVAGKVAKYSNAAASAVMRASGLNALTAARKQAFSMMLMDKYGKLSRSKTWQDLEADDRSFLESTGITERDWQIWQKATPLERSNGSMILSARDIMAIDDAEIMAVIAPEADAMRQGIMAEIDALNQKNLQEQQWIEGRQARFESLKADLQAKIAEYEARQDAKGQAERQALQDRADLLDAQIERAKAQADIDAFLLAEKQQGRIRDFLYAVQEGKDAVKLADKADQNVQRNSSIRGNIGERLGERVGNADRRITEIEAKIRQSERDQTRAVKDKNAEMARRLDRAAQELNDFIAKSTERQTRRQAVADRLNSSIDKRMADLIKRTKEQAATRYMAHILDEQGMAVIEAGARERAKMYGYLQKGTWTGEIGRSMLQFKSFTAALMMRHGARMMGQEGVWGKAAYGIPLFVMMSLLGGLQQQLKEIAQGNDPQDMTQASFYVNAVLAGGALGVYGDVLKSGTTPDGRGLADLVGGPILGDATQLIAIGNRGVRSAMGDNKANAANETIKFAKSHTPFANLWYTRAATDRLIFNQLQEMVNPGYLRRKEARDRRKYDRTSWWSPSDVVPDDTPDFGKAVGE